MPREGQEISNPRTGQRMTFVELRDELLRIDSVNPPTAEREPVHVHPKQESGAEVVSGSLVFEVAGEQRRLAADVGVWIGLSGLARVAGTRLHRLRCADELRQ